MPRTRRGYVTKIAVLGGALLLLLASCKSTADPGATGGATDGTTASAAKTEDARAPGVTDDSIKIGISYVDFSSLGDAGINLNHGDVQGAYQAIIDDINSKGGINGRKLEAVYAPVNPIGTAGADSACTKLTQDEKVFVVVGFVTQDNALCYVNTNQTPLVGGDMTTERVGKAKVAWYALGSDDTVTDVARKLAEDGKLGGKVAVVGADTDQATYDAKIKPALDEVGVNVVDTGFLADTGTDVNLGYNNAQTLAEKFQADGAEQVLVIGPSVAQSFVVGLSRTDYRPELRFTNLGPANQYAQGTGNDVSPLAGALAGGGYDQNQFATLGDPTKECVAIQEAAGLHIVALPDVPKGGQRQLAGSFDACQQLYLVKAILQGAGKELNFGSFKTAGDSLGDIVLPFAPDTWHFGAPPHADGDQVVHIYEFDPATSIFVMTK